MFIKRGCVTFPTFYARRNLRSRCYRQLCFCRHCLRLHLVRNCGICKPTHTCFIFLFNGKQAMKNVKSRVFSHFKFVSFIFKFVSLNLPCILHFYHEAPNRRFCQISQHQVTFGKSYVYLNLSLFSLEVVFFI